ncbi:MAG: hypothetical protein ACW98J_03520 [Candidatus Thorarchaeota archaeon]
MSHGSAQSGSIGSPADPRVVCLIIGTLALFAPLYVWINPSHDMIAILAMTWRFSRIGGHIFWMILDPIHIVAPFPFTVWRLAFVYQMVRYYRGRGTRIGTALLGIFAELPFFLAEFIIRALSPPTMDLWDPGVTFPTPLMLFAGLVFMWMSPYAVPKTPFDDQAEPDRWWQEKADSEVGAPIEPRREDNRFHVSSKLKCPRCGSEEIGMEMYPGTFGVRARFFYSCEKCQNRWEG